nr:hypothetical protein [Tanacetum cinerariifolium]
MKLAEKEIVVRRDGNDLYRVKEGDIPRLRINDIEDMLLIVVQNRLTNLSNNDVSDFAIALRMFTRSLVNQKRVKDLQLGVESYQTKINVTKPETTKSIIRKRDLYTPYQDPQGFIYVDDSGRNRLMHSDKFYKFSDAGNPIKENILKLNLPDHRSILTNSKEYIKMDVEVLGSSRLTRFIAACSYSIDIYKDIMKAKHEHVGPKSQDHKMARLQDDVERLCLVDDIKKFKITFINYRVLGEYYQKASILELKRTYFEDYYSDYQYTVSIKEDTAYPCLHSPKTTKETYSIRRIQRRPIRHQEYSEEEVANTMAKTMEQHMSKTRADYGSGVARPKIKDKDNFKLKGKFLKELHTNTFNDSDHEDANEHIEKVLDIVDLFHILNITIDQPSKKWMNTLRNGTMKHSRSRSTETFNELVAIQAQLNNLGREIKKVNEKVYAALVGCEQCKGPHYTKDYLLKEEGKTLKEAYYTQSMEDTLSKFMSESAKRHEENSNLIKEIQALTDAAIRNQGESIKTLEIQIGSSVSVMPLSTYLNLGSGELAHTNLTIEFADRTMKYPKGIAKNVLVSIDKFVFPIDFIILDKPRDIKVPLILGRPFLSTAHAKIDVYKRKITLRVGEERIIFTSVKPASSFIKRVYMVSLREIELDLEARLIGETMVLNRSLYPFFEDYIDLKDLNKPFKLRRNQGDDLMPTIKEGEVIEEFRTMDDKSDIEIDDYPSDCDYDKKIHIYCPTT